MNFYRMTLILAITTSLLLCGNVFAKPGGNDDVPPTVDVNVVNTPDVNVVNTPVRIPWAMTISTTTPDGDEADGITIFRFPDDYPENHMVVVEEFSYHASAPIGQSVRVRLSVQGDGSITINMPAVNGFPASATHNEFFDSTSIRAYSLVEAPSLGAFVSANMIRNSDVGVVNWSVSASGYFLPIGSPTLAP